MNYFISDTHFGHKGSLIWNNGGIRPQFKDVTDMNNYMIEKWNSVVSDEDTVWFLGDFAYKCSIGFARGIFESLNGSKHLIQGNHDYKIGIKLPWESISQIKQIEIMGKEIIMCHYPMLSWRHMMQGSIHLHGHTHGSIQDKNKGTNRIDMSVELYDYTPQSETQIINESNTKV